MPIVDAAGSVSVVFRAFTAFAVVVVKL